MNQHHDTIKHLADAGAGGVWLFSIASHFAEIANPILTMLLTLASLFWLVVRIREWWKTGDMGE